MFGRAWRRRRAAKAQEADRRSMAELRSRAAVRTAEEVVGSAWIDYLTQRASKDPVAGRKLEWERVAISQASRSRAREAARDQRELADVMAHLEELMEITFPL